MKGSNVWRIEVDLHRMIYTGDTPYGIYLVISLLLICEVVYACR